jgi:tetrapyrrole methylase family protein/MazG family protein
VRRLLSVMATLRGAQGCPWDRAQTHRSLVPYLVEEAYELIEVIESGGASGDETALREELGDVLLQVVFHARIAEERGAFSFADVANTLADKLETRHPHVFGGRPLDSPEAVRHAWHRRKMAGRDSALAGVPAAQPALNRALQVSERAARSGFEWSHEGEILAKVGEELAEFRQAAARHAGDAPAGEAPSLQEETELGDLLFALVQLARWRRIDPESALRRATRKFMARFGWMEDTLRARGLQPDRQTPAQWWALWDEAKSHAP